jgi:hypothetical protein
VRIVAEMNNDELKQEIVRSVGRLRDLAFFHGVE